MRSVAGFGIGLRFEHVAELLASKRQIDFLEIIPENWMRPRERTMLEPVIERWPILAHSIHLSIGGLDPIDHPFLASMRAACKRVQSPVFSDHICYSAIDGMQTNELLPLPFSDEALDNTLSRISQVKPELDVPLLLENPSYYSVMPGSTMEEGTFLRRVIEEGDCGMLLDVNNVFVNSQNHGYDPRALIDQMPLDRVFYIHLAGHRMREHLSTIVDTHSRPIRDEVWSLYEYTIARAGRQVPTLIEWDFDLPSLDVLLDEVDRARTHSASALSNRPAASSAR